MNHLTRAFALFITLLSIHFTAKAEEASFADIIAGLEQKSGLIDVYQDRDEGKIYWLLPPPQGERGRIAQFIYAHGLTNGLGSNPIGLDRGLTSGTELIELRFVGGKVLIEAINTGYRAVSDNQAEARAVRTSFASSILWAGPVAARNDAGEILLDITSFLVRDATGIAHRLSSSGQGNYSLDNGRSVADTAATLAFPENLEFDAILTFTSQNGGDEVRSVAPSSTAVSLIQHHSLIKLPEAGYKTLTADARAAVIALSYLDYSAPLDAPLRTYLARRFRLEKVNPQAERSEVKKPITFYVDNGAPEPIRSALVEGISWWAKAFEEAGFLNAFKVEILPQDAHPMDVRYNVVQWVHRETRGWSYGGGIRDPRTGEMIKAMVILGSQRVRQDRLIFEGLVGADKTGTGGPNDPVQASLARIRQLGAHEVGHTLGFEHNMAASTYGGRASVMDYPAPHIGLHEDGSFDLSDAYGVGVGAWDIFTVKWLYGEGGDDLVDEALKTGLIYVADADSRPASAAHPLGNLWDTGSDPLAELRHLLEVRRLALSRFGPNVLQKGRPMADLQEALVPIYLLHRFQLQAALKSVGGMAYGYPQNGDNQSAGNIVPPDRQREALDIILSALEPGMLDLPDDVLNWLTPTALWPRTTREMFEGGTGPAFDLLSAADVAGGLVIDGLLQRDRAARLVEFNRRDSAYPGLEEILVRLTDQVFTSNREHARLSEIRRALQRRLVSSLIKLAQDDKASPSVTTRIEAHLDTLADSIGRRVGRDRPSQDNAAAIFNMIERHKNRPALSSPASPDPAKTPPGEPIGGAASGWEYQCWHCPAQ